MRAGSLCTGILGLDLAAQAVYGCELAWYSEVEPAACQIIEREHPGVPNLGDLTAVDWLQVETVDVLTAGYPCQPFSHAGKRKGTSDVRHLWPHVMEAVRVLRPRRAVFENVAGHLSLGFGDVLGDLAEAGFDAEWCVLRASDVGACHQRARVFIVAPDAGRERHGGGQDGGAVGRVDSGDAGPSRERERAREESGDRGCATPADPNGGGLSIERVEEPSWIEGTSGGVADGRRVSWGQYAPAIRRWERELGRPAPRPVDDTGRLNPAFVEWMMGYPAGWVDGLSRTQALKALGNAVVPQQGAAAIGLLEAAFVSERAA